MFRQNKLHLVPQAVIDIASALNESRQVSVRASYIERLETTRDYIEAVLTLIDKKQAVTKQ